MKDVFKQGICFVLVLSIVSCGGGGSSSDSAAPDVVDNGGGAAQECLAEFSVDDSWNTVKGGLLYVANSYNKLVYYNIATAQQTVISTERVSYVTPSKNGRYIAYKVAGSSDDYIFYDVVLGNAVDIGIQVKGIVRNAWSPDGRYLVARLNTEDALVDFQEGTVTNLGVRTESEVVWAANSSNFAYVHRNRLTVFSGGAFVGQIEIESSQSNSYLLTDDVAFSPDGRLLSYIKWDQDSYDTYIYQVDDQASTRINESEARAALMFQWSSTSEFLAVADYSDARKLKIYRTSTGETFELDSAVSDLSFVDFKWSPVGNRLAHSAYDGSANKVTLYISSFDMSGQSTNELHPELDKGEELFSLGWSPNGGYLSYISSPEQSPQALHVTDVEHNCYKTIASESGSGEELRPITHWSPSSNYLLYSVEGASGGTDYNVVQADGKLDWNLSPILFNSDEEEVMAYAWLPDSDGVFFELRSSMSTLETDSLNVISVNGLEKIVTQSEEGNRLGGQFWLMPDVN